MILRHHSFFVISKEALFESYEFEIKIRSCRFAQTNMVFWICGALMKNIIVINVYSSGKNSSRGNTNTCRTRRDCEWLSTADRHSNPAKNIRSVDHQMFGRPLGRGVLAYSRIIISYIIYNI